MTLTEQHAPPHRRYNPLAGEWIVVSPQRVTRPWLGQHEKTGVVDLPAHDPECYLCPGNRRAGSAINPTYTDTFVFDNDFPALISEKPPMAASQNPLLKSEPVAGNCRVICFSPRHDLTLPRMQETQIEKVIDVWAAQSAELSEKFRWVQIFENKGAVMGCSNSHPHGQIWSTDFLPVLPEREDFHQKNYFKAKQSPLLLDYAETEIRDGTRVVEANSDWLLVVPYWATWPFEYLLLPRRPVSKIEQLTNLERRSLSRILKRGLSRYDNLFETPFPYSLGWHGAPGGIESKEHWQLHAHLFPPLLRSSSVRKFMVGYEMLAESQRDLTAEEAAERLRSVSAIHYLDRSR
jgi:UDPglucose--hexose-1-phosphate uridylyltransferase